ncbi:hypothetical protein [Flavobacterium sp.]
MKNLRFLVYIYVISIALSFTGYWIDSDVPNNGFAFQMFEVFVMSLFLAGILMAGYILVLCLFNSIKNLLSR